jgi:hypothetical protein
MATVTKDFRVKAGLVVEGSTATVNGHDILTEALVDAKGDLLVASAADTVTRLAAGSNGYVLTANSSATNGIEWSAPQAVGEFGSSILFEGATANDFETTLQVTDPTGDRTITLPDASGTVALTSDITVSASSTNTFSNKSIALGSNTVTGTISEFNSALTDADFVTIAGVETLTNKTLTSPSVSGLNLTDSSIVFEGSSADSSETTLTVTNPTDDRTITLPDASGTVALTSDIPSLSGYVTESGTQTLTNKTLTSPVVSGLTLSDGSFVVEGSTANEFETTVQFTDPTGDRTITIPNVTGTVVTTGDTGSVTNTMLAGSIANDKLSNSAITINGTSTSLGGSRTLGSDDIAEGSTNKYFTDERAQDAIGNAVGSGLDYDDSSGAISVDPSEFALSAVGAPTGNVSMATYKITSLGTPTDGTDAATKAYVDSVTEGLHIHESVVAATTTNVNLANALENGDTLDGITLATGNRILVKNQTTQSENGIYVVAASGQPTRATDFDTATEVDSGDFVFVYSGTANASTGWVQTNKPATIGTDPIVFTQFSGAGTYLAGNGLTLTGNSFSINTTITADLSTAQTLTNKTIDGGSNTLSNIANNSLTNSAITINGTSTSLGGTRTLVTDDIAEDGSPTNLWFTDERAQDAVGNAVGTGLSYTDSTGAIANTGVLSITGTSNQVVADVSTGAVTLSLPQSINSTATPTFSGVTVGSVTLTDALLGTATATASDSATTIDSWAVATYSSAKYIVQMKKGSDIEVIEVLVTVDGANNVYLTEYADVISNAVLGTTNAVYSGGNVLLQVTGTTADTVVKVSKTYIEA